MSDFPSELARLCTRELAAARRDPDRMADMMERMIASLALTLSVAGGGDARRVSTLLEGAIAHLTEEAARDARLLSVPPIPRRMEGE